MAKNFIEKNMKSNNALTRILYTDLKERIDDYEEGDAKVESIEFSDAVSSIVIVALFALYLLLI